MLLKPAGRDHGCAPISEVARRAVAGCRPFLATPRLEHRERLPRYSAPSNGAQAGVARRSVERPIRDDQIPAFSIPHTSLADAIVLAVLDGAVEVEGQGKVLQVTNEDTRRRRRQYRSDRAQIGRGVIPGRVQRDHYSAYRHERSPHPSEGLCAPP